MADPNGHQRRLPAGDPGRLNLGSSPASSASAATSALSAAADFAPSSRDVVYVPVSLDVPLLPVGHHVNLDSASAAGDAMINSAGAPAGAHQYMTNPYAGDAMINSAALAGAHPHPHMVNPPPYAGASSSRLPTASAEWNGVWLHPMMAEQQQQQPPPPPLEQSVFFPPTAYSFIPSPSLHPVHAPYPSFAPSAYFTIPTVLVEFMPVPYQVPAPHAPPFPATYHYPGAPPAAAHTMRDSSPTGTRIPASMGDRKTMMCVRYEWHGWCNEGDGCQFAHHEDEQRIVQGRWGSRWWHRCNQFAASGWCRYGRNCRYSHDRRGGV